MGCTNGNNDSNRRVDVVQGVLIAETSYAVIYEYSYLITGGFVGFILWNAELNLSSISWNDSDYYLGRDYYACSTQYEQN